MMRRTTTFSLALSAALLWACGAQPTPGGDGGTDGGAGDSCSADAGLCAAARYTESLAACMPLSTDYRPRDNLPGANGWPACITDDNTFHLIGAGIPAAAARVSAFDAMAAKLWGNRCAPSPTDFLSARDDYSVAQGLGSRVARRQDVSYPEVPGADKFACAMAGVPDQYPDRCAGPAKLKPIIEGAFAQGIAGVEPRSQAARIEAALLWFMHLSMTSEVWTCSFVDLEDCDAAAAYYSGETTRASRQGYAGAVARLGPGTHDRIFDALLAQRCWRDVDMQLPTLPTAADGGVAGRYDLYQRSAAQLDVASLRGMALILRERIGQLTCSTGDELAAHTAFVKVLGGLMVHAAQLRDATKAARLAAFAAAPTGDAAAVATAQADLDAVFSCP